MVVATRIGSADDGAPASLERHRKDERIDRGLSGEPPPPGWKHREGPSQRVEERRHGNDR